MNVVLMHGMSCRLDECWKPYLTYELSKKYEVIDPQLPLKREITLDGWIKGLDKYKHIIGEDTVLVCHSLATVFIVKYLTLRNIKVKGLIAVSGGYVPITAKQYEFLSEFLMTQNEFDYVVANVPTRVHIHSDNDDVWTKKQIDDYTSNLKMKEIVLHNAGHIGRRSGVKELPQIIDIINNIE